MYLAEYVEKSFFAPDGEYRWVIASDRSSLVVIKKDNSEQELIRWEFRISSLPQIKPAERIEIQVEKEDSSDVVVADAALAFLQGFICGLNYNPEVENPGIPKRVLQ
jgi:RecA/RadA recombinase